MDYAGGIDLAAFQWNIIANPAPLTWFDSDGDGMAKEWEYYIPVWGESIYASEAWNEGRYFHYVGWMLMGVADGLFLGLLAEAGVAAKGAEFYGQEAIKAFEKKATSKAFAEAAKKEAIATLQEATKGITKDGINIATKTTATGQAHHILSNPIMRALGEHPTLKGIYRRSDQHFIYRAFDEAAHKGYQAWHRQYDQIVTEWLRNTPNATPEMFEKFLNDLYQEPWLMERIPNVNLIK
jgi:hypothetical protein